MEKLLTEQKKKIKVIDEMFQAGNYTLEHPLILLNPYEVCPLSGLMLFEMQETGVLYIEVEGIKGSVPLGIGKNEVPLLGLKPGKSNTIKVEVQLKETIQTYIYKMEVDALPADYPKIEVKVCHKEKMEEGLLALSLGKAEGVKTTVPLYSMIDTAGEVRWLYTKMTAHVFRKLQNGNLMVDAPVSSGICGAYTSAGFIEMDMVGRIIDFYPIPNGLHHDVYELPNGNFLAITQREDTKQDLLVEIDRQSKEVVREWDFRKILDPTRQTVIDKVSVNHPLDWLHLN
ncbi:MAG: aryl-sulfate sulfotransferase, partial [Cellulosilyticaceae bacterium]